MAMATIGTRIFTFLKGKKLGEDEMGNLYYEGHRARPDGIKKRWVIYKGLNEPSQISAEWHNWLHYTTDILPEKNPQKYAWQKPHQPNLTGTSERYLPPGHLDRGGHRDASASGDYQAWKP